MKKPFPHTLQLDAMDCGPACLKMIAKYYGKNYSIQYLRERSYITRMGVSMLGISEAADDIGFCTNGVEITFEQLIRDVPLPCILHWKQNHFVVCYGIKKKHHEITQSVSPTQPMENTPWIKRRSSNAGLVLKEMMKTLA